MVLRSSQRGEWIIGEIDVKVHSFREETTEEAEEASLTPRDHLLCIFRPLPLVSVWNEGSKRRTRDTLDVLVIRWCVREGDSQERKMRLGEWQEDRSWMSTNAEDGSKGKDKVSSTRLLAAKASIHCSQELPQRSKEYVLEGADGKSKLQMIDERNKQRQTKFNWLETWTFDSVYEEKNPDVRRRWKETVRLLLLEQRDGKSRKCKHWLLIDWFIHNLEVCSQNLTCLTTAPSFLSAFNSNFTSFCLPNPLSLASQVGSFNLELHYQQLDKRLSSSILIHRDFLWQSEEGFCEFPFGC